MNRGGSWNNDAQYARAANRNNNDPDNRNDNLGFRLASPGAAGLCAHGPERRDHGPAARAMPLTIVSEPVPGGNATGPKMTPAPSNLRTHVTPRGGLPSSPAVGLEPREAFQAGSDIAFQYEACVRLL